MVESKKPKGGRRPGAGRPPVDSQAINLRLKRTKLAWIDAQPGRRSEVVERLVNEKQNGGTMNTAYIINHGLPIARMTGQFKSGPCRFGWQRSAEALNANREWNLVNARDGKISNAKKWMQWENGREPLPAAIELNPGEFLIL